MSGIVNSTGARSGVIGTTVGTPVAEGVPSDVVAYRGNGVSTPSGWTEFTTARGRMIVGLQSGGADAGTVGTALTTAQDKTHTHTYSHKHQLIWHVQGGSSSYLYYDATNTFGTGDAGSHEDRHTVDTHTVGGMSYSLTDTPYSSSNSYGTSATSDVLAYIQLMTIKKD